MHGLRLKVLARTRTCPRAFLWYTTWHARSSSRTLCSMRFASIFTLTSTDLVNGYVNFEFFHRRRFRRNLLLATATLSLAELQYAAIHGYALDRWLPLIMSPDLQQVTGAGTGGLGGFGTGMGTTGVGGMGQGAGASMTIGLLHVLARIEVRAAARYVLNAA